MIHKNGKRFTVSQKAEIRNLYEDGYALAYIARKFKCNSNSIWNNVFELSTPRVFNHTQQKWAMLNSKISIVDVKKLRLLAKSGIGSIALAKMFNISQSTALSVLKGRTYRWVSGWIRPKRNMEFIHNEPIKIQQQERKSDRKRGVKPGSHKSSKYGELLELAKKYKVSTSSICRWKQKGKI